MDRRQEGFPKPRLDGKITRALSRKLRPGKDFQLPRPANSCKVWTNEHARHAYLTFKNPKLTDRQKAESFSILGRSFIAVAAMVSAVDTAYEKRTTSKTNAFLNRGPWELAYIRGERDSYTPTRADLGVFPRL